MRKYYSGKNGATFPTYRAQDYYSYYVFEEEGSLYSKTIGNGSEALLAGPLSSKDFEDFVKIGVWEEIPDPFKKIHVGDLLQGSDCYVYKVTKVGEELIQASTKSGPNKVFLKETMQELISGELKLTKL